MQRVYLFIFNRFGNRENFFASFLVGTAGPADPEAQGKNLRLALLRNLEPDWRYLGRYRSRRGYAVRIIRPSNFSDHARVSYFLAGYLSYIIPHPRLPFSHCDITLTR
jgi:hypothetical protein